MIRVAGALLAGLVACSGRSKVSVGARTAAWPLVALPGDLEPVPAPTEAIAAARQRGWAVIDGRLLQRIELLAATIALVPGAGAASRSRRVWTGAPTAPRM